MNRKVSGTKYRVSSEIPERRVRETKVFMRKGSDANYLLGTETTVTTQFLGRTHDETGIFVATSGQNILRTV